MKQKITKLFAVAFLCFAFNNLSLAQAQWQVLGTQTAATPPLPQGVTPGAAEHLSLAVSAAGVPYIAFVNPLNDRKVEVRRYDATAGWTNVGAAGISGGIAGTTSLTIAPDGTPYLFYKDMRTENLEKGVIMRFNGTSWVTVGNHTGLSEGTIEWPVIVINAQGVPHIAFREKSLTSAPATVKRLNTTTGEWTALGVPALAQAGITRHNIFFDNDGRLFWGGQDWARSSVYRYSGEGTAWTKVGTGNTTLGARSAIGTLDPVNNVPYLMYLENGGAGINNNITVYKFTDTGESGWSVVGPAQFSGGNADFPNIVIDPTGTPVVAYKESATNKSVIKRYNSTGNTWDYLPSPWGNALSQGVGNNTVLAKDAAGNLYVAFTDAGVENKAVVLKYAVGTPTSIATEVDRLSAVLAYPNPSSSAFTIQAAGKFSFSVYNSTGQLMERGQGFGEGKAGSELNAGLYFMHLETTAGNKMLKLLKQ